MISYVSEAILTTCLSHTISTILSLIYENKMGLVILNTPLCQQSIMHRFVLATINLCTKSEVLASSISEKGQGWWWFQNLKIGHKLLTVLFLGMFLFVS